MDIRKQRIDREKKKNTQTRRLQINRFPVPVEREDELLPWHIQYWRLGIATWHGRVVKHGYILHRAFQGVGQVMGWKDAGAQWSLADGLTTTGLRLLLKLVLQPQSSWCLVSTLWTGPGRPQPLWMYFLMTTQPCLKSGHGSDCRSVQVLVQGSNVSIFPRTGPSLLTVPPVA